MLESRVMTKIILAVLLLASLPQKSAQNDPNGTWQTDSGTKFELRLTGSDLKVQLVEGSTPLYVKYEVDLKNVGDPNRYEGKGYFVANLQEKQCRFDTNWRVIVVQPGIIAGFISHVVPDPATCEVRDRTDEFVQLRKTK